MNKLIWKTAAITLSVAIAVSVLSVCVTALFFPSTLASSAAKAGMYGVSANFQQISYTRDPSTEKLGKLIDYAAASNRHSLLIEYCPVMAENKYFEEYAAFRDGNNGEYVAGNYKNYLYGNYATALYKKSRKVEALEAVKTVVQNSYPKNNAAQYLLYVALEKEDDAFLLSLVEYLEGLYYYMKLESGAANTTEMANAAKDVYLIYTAFGEEYEPIANQWLTRI